MKVKRDNVGTKDSISACSRAFVIALRELETLFSSERKGQKQLSKREKRIFEKRRSMKKTEKDMVIRRSLFLPLLSAVLLSFPSPPPMCLRCFGSCSAPCRTRLELILRPRHYVVLSWLVTDFQVVLPSLHSEGGWKLSFFPP